MTDSEYVSMVVRCNRCSRTFTHPIGESIEKSIEELSISGCIYCKSSESTESKQLEVLSLEKDAKYDPFLEKEWYNLIKYVNFE